MRLSSVSNSNSMFDFNMFTRLIWCVQLIELKIQLWTVIAGLLSVLIFADPFYSSNFNLY